MLRQMFAGLALAITLLTVALPAAASPGEITWTTWFRIGPGRNYAVRDEIPNQTVLDVVGCANGWCQVVWGNWTGYVESNTVAQPVPATAAPPQPHDCVQVERSGYGKGDPLNICER